MQRVPWCRCSVDVCFGSPALVKRAVWGIWEVSLVAPSKSRVNIFHLGGEEEFFPSSHQTLCMQSSLLLTETEIVMQFVP